MNSGLEALARVRATRGLMGRAHFFGALMLGLGASGCSGDNADADLSGGAGSAGTNGKDGVNGSSGKDGVDGKNGKTGKTGTNGVDGSNGTNGTNGVDGSNGTNGVDGTDAVLPGPVAIFITTPPKKLVTTRAAQFVFGCSAGDCEYECSLDDAAFSSCESPLSVTPSDAGAHALHVRAKSSDPADELDFGNVTTASWTARRPNILTIVADDLGFSDIGALGGEIDTPNLDALVAQGRLLTNHHVGTVCAITRAMLISGTDHHRVGEGTMGAPGDERTGLPGYEGYLNDRSLSIAQLLQDGGYHTYMAGKWHLGSRIVGETTGGGQTPDQWGFERSYALLGGAAGNHYAHETATSKNFTRNGAYAHPGQPGEPSGFSTELYTDQLIGFIDENAGDGKPFFAYAAYTAPHWPLSAPEPWLSKYKGKYDAGYEPIRQARLRRQYDRGIIAESLTPTPGFPESLTRSPATPNNGSAAALYTSAVHSPVDGYVDSGLGPVIKNWDSLSPLEKKAQARYMEIYAAMVDHLDYSIGRLIQHLKDIDEYDSTFIIFHSDSGAEGWPINSGADPTATDSANGDAALLPILGTDNGAQNARNIKYGLRWAAVSNTPIDQFKGYQGEGGLSAPAIVHLPGQTEQLPIFRHFTHVTDDTATFLELAGVEPPTTPAPALIDEVSGIDKNAGKVVYDGRYVYPVTGHSLLSAVQHQTPERVHTEPFGGEAYGRAFLLSADGKWKIRWTEPPYGPVDGHWQLFYIENDRAETNDLSASYPDWVATLVGQWKDYLTSVGGVEPLRPRGYY